MVKLGGPAMSLDASGTIGGILTFSKWKGRAYVRTRVIPSNPKSDAQSAVRACMKFLAQNWAGLATPNKLSWDPMAEANKYSAFNGFSSLNLRNWRDFLYPGKSASMLRTVAAAAVTGTVATAAGRYANSVVTLGAGASQWGLAVFMSTQTGFTPNWNNLRLMVAAAPGGDTTINIGPLAADTYYLRYATFSADGNEDVTYVTEDSVVIA